MIKKCPKCGAEYPEKLLYCVKCGKKLVYEFSEYTYYETKESTIKWKWVAAIVAIAAILIGGWAFLFCKTKSSKFAYITNDEVTIHYSPSVSSQILMIHPEKEGLWKYCWAYEFNDEYSVEYRDRGSIVQVISKQDDWYKVRFYSEHEMRDFVSDGGVQYVEGWISCENLKMVEPIKLTWDISPIIEKDWSLDPAKHCYIVDDANIPQIVFIQYWFEDEICMFYGNIKHDYLEIYGSRDDLKVPSQSEDYLEGISIEKEGNCNVLHYGWDVASQGIDDCDTYDVDVRKCTPQMREQIYKSISNKPYSRRYYFNIGEGDEEDIRSFEIIY